MGSGSPNLENTLHVNYATIFYLVFSKEALILPKRKRPFELQFSRVKMRAGPRQPNPAPMSLSASPPAPPPLPSLSPTYLNTGVYTHVDTHIHIFSYPCPWCKYITFLLVVTSNFVWVVITQLIKV